MAKKSPYNLQITELNPVTGLEQTTDFNFVSSSFAPSFVGRDVTKDADYMNDAGKGFYENEQVPQTLYETQSTLQTIGNGVARIGTGAVLKTLSGAGRVVGLLTGGTEGAMENPFANAVDEYEQKTKDYFDIKHNEGYRDESVWDKMGKIGFWSDEGADGAGFLLSAVGGGALVGAAAKGLGIGTRLAQLISEGSTMAKEGTVASEGMSASIQALLKGGDKHAITAYNTAMEALTEGKGVHDKIMESLYDGKTINPRTGEVYSYDEAKTEAAKGARETALLNAIVLLGPNAIQTEMFFGKAAIEKSAIQKLFTSGTLEAPITPTIKEFAKNIGKDAAISAVSEGLWEENSQLAIQNYIQDKRILHTDEGYSKIVSNMIDNFSTNEGQESMFLGAAMGIFGAGKHGYSNTRDEYKQTKAVYDQMLLNTNLFEVAGQNLYEYDSNGNVIKENGEPKIDREKVKKAVAGLTNALHTSEEKVSAMLNDDVIKSGYLNHKAITQLTQAFMQNEGGEDALKTYLDFNKSKALDEAKGDVKATAEVNDLYVGYEQKLPKLIAHYDAVSKGFGGLLMGKNKVKLEKARRDLISTQFNEGAELIGLQEAVEDLDKQNAKLKSTSFQTQLEFGPEHDLFLENEKTKTVLNKLIEQKKESLKELYDFSKQENLYAEQLEKIKNQEEANKLRTEEEVKENNKKSEPEASKDDLLTVFKDRLRNSNDIDGNKAILKEFVDKNPQYKTDLKNTFNQVQEVLIATKKKVEEEQATKTDSETLLKNLFPDASLTTDNTPTDTGVNPPVEIPVVPTEPEKKSKRVFKIKVDEAEQKAAQETYNESQKEAIDENPTPSIEEVEREIPFNEEVPEEIIPVSTPSSELSDDVKEEVKEEAQEFNAPVDEKVKEEITKTSGLLGSIKLMVQKYHKNFVKKAILWNPTSKTPVLLSSKTGVNYSAHVRTDVACTAQLEGKEGQIVIRQNEEGKDVLNISYNGKIVGLFMSSENDELNKQITDLIKEGKQVYGTFRFATPIGNNNINNVIDTEGKSVFFNLENLTKNTVSPITMKQEENMPPVYAVITGSEKLGYKYEIVQSGKLEKHYTRLSQIQLEFDSRTAEADYAGQMFVVTVKPDGTLVPIKVSTKNLNKGTIDKIIETLKDDKLDFEEKKKLVGKVLFLDFTDFDKSNPKNNERRADMYINHKNSDMLITYIPVDGKPVNVNLSKINTSEETKLRAYLASSKFNVDTKALESNLPYEDIFGAKHASFEDYLNSESEQFSSKGEATDNENNQSQAILRTDVWNNNGGLFEDFYNLRIVDLHSNESTSSSQKDTKIVTETESPFKEESTIEEQLVESDVVGEQVVTPNKTINKEKEAFLESIDDMVRGFINNDNVVFLDENGNRC